jgi:hypothetical protein
MLRRSGILALAVVGLSLGLTGCSPFSMAERAYYEVRGAQGDVICISRLADDALARFQSVRFEPATATVGRQLAPPALLSAWNAAGREEEETLRAAYSGGAPALRVSSEILYFQRKGLMSGGECLARVRMYDGDQMAADVMVRSESKAFRAGGERDLANAAVKAIGQFLSRQKHAEAPPEDRADRE